MSKKEKQIDSQTSISDKKSLQRFSAAITEVEGRSACGHCGGPLEKVTPPLQGIGDYTILPYMHCKNCDLVYIFTEGDDHEN